MTSHLRTTLFCLHCDRATEHVITYVADKLSTVACEECGTTLSVDRQKLAGRMAADAVERILTKPKRMTEEMRADLARFISSMPIRIVTKPYRLAKEVMDVVSGEGKQ